MASTRTCADQRTRTCLTPNSARLGTAPTALVTARRPVRCVPAIEQTGHLNKREGTSRPPAARACQRTGSGVTHGILEVGLCGGLSCRGQLLRLTVMADGSEGMSIGAAHGTKLAISAVPILRCWPWRSTSPSAARAGAVSGSLPAHHRRARLLLHRVGSDDGGTAGRQFRLRQAAGEDWGQARRPGHSLQMRVLAGPRITGGRRVAHQGEPDAVEGSLSHARRRLPRLYCAWLHLILCGSVSLSGGVNRHRRWLCGGGPDRPVGPAGLGLADSGCGCVVIAMRPAPSPGANCPAVVLARRRPSASAACPGAPCEVCGRCRRG